MPDGDCLIHCGDFTNYGRVEKVYDFIGWLREQRYYHKIVIAGNHDKYCAQAPHALLKEMFASAGAFYLQDEGVIIEGRSFYGTPWVPMFGSWSFMTGPEERRRQFEKIPQGLDVLITHGPPYDVLDETMLSDNAGCPILAEIVAKVQPKVHCFGHIHECGGLKKRVGDTICINAAQDVMCIDLARL
jgi:predicted phosphodiesterase